MKRLLLTCALGMIAGAAHAAGGCETPRTPFDQAYCLSTVYAQSDHELNDTYTRLRKQLNANDQAALKQGQLAWIKQRDSQCGEQRGNAFLVDLSCAIETTQSRLSFLKTRERECRSTGCVHAELGK
ncbi:lysozyme inhibitor LprI family protein [Chitinasiproducens palmae]|uniref:Uncharacterized conserved protein YecT, DUF1311 family n=1 Tax=Chitinasiproducens palmae TaxID=1770053 RepID=A0A1H2PKG0_9BURK|nr:lysozyme inhibitor LprI family protein [Chitinasiproducens palmae]SDV46878.1 Uncharacterized conserved protein YecT, DUF1311 family [Chitinasiproducens palmae]